MRDGWEIEDSSSEKVQSVYSSKRSQSVSQMRNNEAPPPDLSKFKFKSLRQFSEHSDIEHFDSILLRDSKTLSSLRDVKQQRLQDRDEEILISSCELIGNISVKEKSYNSEIGLQAIVEEDDELLKMNSNMERERTSGNISALKYRCIEDDEKIKANNCSQGKVFNEEDTKDYNNLSPEGKANGNGAVMSLQEEAITLSPTAVCHEETNSAGIMQQKSPKLVQEKDNSKRRISFRALVRMKGLGRRMRKKHQSPKKREKYSNHRNESGSQIKDFKSDSSAKYLLESSTSTSEEQTFSTQMKIVQRKEEPARYQRPKNLQRSQSLNQHKDQIFQNSDELSCSSGENVCSLEYLQRRRGAMCEELEKTLRCGQQSLADLRAILVVQQKLTGFGLL